MDPPAAPARKKSFLLTSQGWPYLLVPFIPLAVVLELAHAGAVIIFFASALGVIPTAALMGRATEELAARSGPGIGGLLNVTFGNAPELIIALFALGAGLHEVVKASIIGSIMGNTLLVLGAAMLAGGWKRDRQYFDRTAASAQSSMLLLAAAALVMPAVYELIDGRGLPMPGAERVHYDSTVEALSAAVAVVLILSYAAGLWFSLKTHRSLFNPAHEEEEGHDRNDGDRPVLPPQIRRSAFLDGAGDLLHPTRPRRLPQQPHGQADAVRNRDERANEREENGVIVEPAHHKVRTNLRVRAPRCCIKVWPRAAPTSRCRRSRWRSCSTA